MTRTEVLKVIQDQARTRAWGGLDMMRVLVEYGRAVAELAVSVPPDIVLQRWKDDHYLPEPPGAPEYNRAIFWGEKEWR